MDLSLVNMMNHDNAIGEAGADTTDEKLVTLAATDDRYFEILVDRYENKLQRYIMRFINCSVQDSQDIVQEVFINAYRNLNGFDIGLKFSSW